MVSVVTCCSCALMLAVLPEPRKIGLGPGASTDSPVGVFRVDVRPGETLVSVRDRVRALPDSVRTGGIEVVFPSGDLELEGTLELESSDGGLSPAAPVVWRAEKPGGVRLTTSRRIPVGRFAKVTDPAVLRRLPPDVRGRVLVADVGDFLKTGDAASAEVFVNGDFATCARWPNGGEYTSFTGRVDSGTCKGVLYERGAFVYPNPRAKRWDFAKGVRFFGYWTHDWHGEEATAHFYGTENGTNDVIRLSTPVLYGVNSGTWGRPERRFYAWDLPEELDMPREWWIDREKRRLYILPENGSFGPDDRICLAVKSPPIIRAKGLRNFVFRGLVFEHHNGEAMVLSQADGVSVQGCGFSCVCGDAKIYRSAALALDGVRCRVSDCRMRHLGAGGIRLDGGDRRGLVRSDTVVERCEIIDFGVRRRTYHGAVEAEGCGHVIRHNEFAYAPHHAMRYETNDSIIEYNDIHHVLLETGDAGAIYTGRDCTTQGNVVRYNFIHELGSEGVDDSTMGLYFDDCDCGDEVYGNVFWKCARGILLGGGRDHPIRGNVFADCSVGLSIDMRGKTWGCFYRRKKGGEDSYQPDRMDRMRVTEEPWKSCYPHLANQLNDLPEVPLHDPVEGNVFLNCGKSLVQLAGEELTPYLPRMTFASNLVYVSSGRETAKPDERIRGGFVICGEEDPGFVDAAKGDFRLKRDASVLRQLPAFGCGERATVSGGFPNP